jgi:hypothetical protein
VERTSNACRECDVALIGYRSNVSLSEVTVFFRNDSGSAIYESTCMCQTDLWFFVSTMMSEGTG